MYLPLPTYQVSWKSVIAFCLRLPFCLTSNFYTYINIVTSIQWKSNWPFQHIAGSPQNSNLYSKQGMWKCLQIISLQEKWRACFQNLLHLLPHVTHFNYWLHLVIKKTLFYVIVFILWVTFTWHIQQNYKVIKSGNEWHAKVKKKRFWNPTTLYFFVFLYVRINFLTGAESSSYKSCRIWIC